MSESFHDYVVASLPKTLRGMAEVAAATKISRSTLLKIRDGHIPNPGVKSIETLYHYFKRRHRRKAA